MINPPKNSAILLALHMHNINPIKFYLGFRKRETEACDILSAAPAGRPDQGHLEAQQQGRRAHRPNTTGRLSNTQQVNVLVVYTIVSFFSFHSCYFSLNYNYVY